MTPQPSPGWIHSSADKAEQGKESFILKFTVLMMKMIKIEI